MLTAAELGAFVRANLTRHAFRYEGQPAYAVAADGGEFGRYLAGEAEPDDAVWGPWADRLRGERARGITRSRVHALIRPLTPYLRYECEWGYRVNVDEGEDVRVLDLTGWATRPQLPARDFWLIDDQHVIDMHYAEDYTFTGAVILGPDALPRYQAARDRLFATAEPFGPWWAAHSEEHRANWMRGAA